VDKNYITKKEYQENFEGFAIKSMAGTGSRDIYLCTLVEDLDYSDPNLPQEKAIAREGDLEYRFLNFELEKPKNYVTYMGINAGCINRALIVHSEKDGWISVDFNGMVWEGKVEALQNWPGYRIPQTDPIKPKKSEPKAKRKEGLAGLQLNAPGGEWAFPKGRLRYIKELTVIDNVVYACGGVRKVLRRESYDKWTDLTLMKEHPQLQQEYLDAQKIGEKSPLIGSFNSMDGFNGSDIYACGSGGDFWHYDAKIWTKIHMPNVELNKVVCAADGNVYVAARDGKVFKGRAKHGKNKELWKLIESDTKGLIGNPFEGAAWFKEKLYLSTSYGLYELGKDEKIKAVDFGNEVQHSFQHVTANDDILISYGPYNALVFDGTEWKTIVSSLLK